MAPMFRSPSAEFPNDNPLLHDGASWLCESVRGPATAVVEAVARPSFSVASSIDAAVVAPLEEAMQAVAAVTIGAYAPAQNEVALDEPAELVASEEAAAAVVDPSRIELVAAVVEVIAAPEVEVAEVEAPADERRTPTTTIVPPAPTGFAAFVAALVDIAMAEGATGAAIAICELLERGAVTEDLLEAEVAAGLLTSRFVVRAAAGLDASEELGTLIRGWRAVLDHNDFSGCGATTLIEWAAELLAAALGGQGRVSAMQYELRRRGVAAFGMVKKAA